MTQAEEDACHNGTAGCSFDPDGDEALELRREIAALFESDAPVCGACVTQEILSVAASLHLHQLKRVFKGDVIPANRIYKDFCDTAYRELHKLVDLEIEHGGMTAHLRQ